MGINKVIYNGQVLIDLTSSTVTPETLVEGTIAFNSAGEQIVGTLVISGGYTNQVPISINADGTIYNGGVGYKNGYRVRSGGAEATQSSASCTGFIKVKPNDVIRLKGWDMKVSSNGNTINIFDESFTNLGQWASNYALGYGGLEGTTYGKTASMIDEGDGVFKWVIPPAEFNVAYIRVTGVTNGDGSVMIVTVNEEIK